MLLPYVALAAAAAVILSRLLLVAGRVSPKEASENLQLESEAYIESLQATRKPKTCKRTEPIRKSQRKTKHAR